MDFIINSDEYSNEILEDNSYRSGYYYMNF